jgi:hypothetical protein
VRARRAEKGALLLIALFGAVGCVLLLLDNAEYDAARQFKAAVECPDASSGACYQLYPGVLTQVRRARTSSGEQDAVTVESRGRDLHLSLLPSPADASLLTPGVPVRVEWYVGSVAAVWIEGRPIPTTSNLAAGHANIGYVGGILLWLAALFLAILLLNRRMARLLASVRVLPRAAVAVAQTILPSGNAGWIVRPRLREALVLPLGLVVLALISIRPFMNPQTRALALIGDVVVFGPVAIAMVMTLRNARLFLDRTSIERIDRFGRSRSWPVSGIREVVIFGVRWTDWMVPSLVFVGSDGVEQFWISALVWDVGEVIALCAAIGVPVTNDYMQKAQKRNWCRQLSRAAVLVVTGALLAASFLPLPPSTS